jgi:uncharacterized membrane protein YqhA
MFIGGAVKTYHAFTAVILRRIPKESWAHLSRADVATAYLIKSLDAFLIAFVLFIFAYGIYSLFIANQPDASEPEALKWIRMRSISHLKIVLAEVIVIILFVKFLEVALLSLEKMEWDLLVLPGSILLLALGLKFLGLKHDSDRSESGQGV